MPLHHNSCADEPPILNHERNCHGGSSRLPDDRSASCDAGSSRVSVSDNDLMITSAPRENSATMGATLGSSSCPGTDLHTSLHAMNRLDESLLNSRHQPRLIFSSSAAAADHERGFSVAGGWSPRCYACSFCGREFNSAQALGGHMNIHRRDRARLRTSSTSAPASLPHQSDFAPILQNTPQSAHTNLYNTFDAAFRENPTTISNYTAPAIISATPTFRLLNMHPPADPASAAYPSQDENPTAPFSAPLGDLVPFCSTRSSSCATRLSKAQNEAHSLFPNIAPHASPLPIRPNLENSALKHVEALAGQASTRHEQVSLDCEAAGGAQLIQFSQSKGRLKRARGDALDSATASSNSTGQRSDIEQTSNFLHAAADAAGSCVKPATPHIKGLLCLDLELRLGQSSPSDSREASSTTAGDCFMWTSTAPRPP